jgi:hypothetical protein
LLRIISPSIGFCAIESWAVSARLGFHPYPPKIPFAEFLLGGARSPGEKHSERDHHGCCSIRQRREWVFGKDLVSTPGVQTREDKKQNSTQL